MKKLLTILMILSMSLSFCACGAAKEKEAPVVTESPAPSTEPTAQPTETPSEPAVLAAEQPHTAADYAELFHRLNDNDCDQEIWAEASNEAEKPVAAQADFDDYGAEAATAADVPEYSGTNVQVEGIDEGDIVKTDGEYIYVLRGGETLTILKADGADTAVICTYPVGYSDYSEDDGEDGYSYHGESRCAEEMFISGDRLAVIGGFDRYAEEKNNGEWHYDSQNYIFVDIYDVSDPTAPQLLCQLGQDGYLKDTRLLDGMLYVITGYYVWGDYDEDEPRTFVPCVYANGDASAIVPEDIVICPNGENRRYIVVSGYDLAEAVTVSELSLLGAGDNVYMNENAIYLMGSEWETQVTGSYQESVYTVSEELHTVQTAIQRLSIDNGSLTLAASGTVPGYINDQFSADEYQAYFRIVTTRDEQTYKIYEDKEYDFRNYVWGESVSDNALYILDGGLNIVGSVENLAEGEYVYSARFDGDIAYFCTYQSVDPLFAVDVSDPADPVILSSLKISGFSEYLHSWGSDRLFGFGQETNEETGWTEGLKLVMFNTADKTGVTVENYLVLDDLYYSEALYNHKAFFIDNGKNIIGFLGDEDYYIFSYTPEEGFKELSHFWFDTNEWNVRGLWIGDWAYIVGYQEAMLINMQTWEAPIPLNLNGIAD